MNRLFLLFILLLLSGCSLFSTSKPLAFPEPRAVDIDVSTAPKPTGGT